MNHETAYQTEGAVEYSQGKYIGGWGGGGLLYKSDRCERQETSTSINPLNIPDRNFICELEFISTPGKRYHLQNTTLTYIQFKFLRG